MGEGEENEPGFGKVGSPDDLVCLARIVAAHGVRGEVVLKSYCERPENVAAYGPLFDETGERVIEIVGLRLAKKGVVARLKGIEDRNAAEALKGLRLHVRRSVLPAPQADEWYHADLIGLEVVTPEGVRIGTLVAIHDFGAGDLLEIGLVGNRGTKGKAGDKAKGNAGDKAKGKAGDKSGDTVLVPFTRAHVPEVDPARGRVVVTAPEFLSIETD